MSKCDSCEKDTESVSLTKQTSDWRCDECVELYCEEYGRFNVCIDPDGWKSERNFD